MEVFDDILEEAVSNVDLDRVAPKVERLIEMLRMERPDDADGLDLDLHFLEIEWCVGETCKAFVYDAPSMLKRLSDTYSELDVRPEIYEFYAAYNDVDSAQFKRLTKELDRFL